MRSVAKIDPFEYFVGAVPPGGIFKMNIEDLRKVVKSSRTKKGQLDPIAEVCLVGLVSYFEAVCKDLFAAIVNICPQVLHNFCQKRRDVFINVEDLLILGFETQNMLGFILAEKYDFGSAKSINSLYCDLLSITPFSTKEAKEFDRLLNDRNLLVHHGGTYTMKYRYQKFVKQSVHSRVYYDSLVVNKADFMVWADFIEKMAVKLLNTNHRALTEYIKSNKVRLDKGAKGALEWLNYYD